MSSPAMTGLSSPTLTSASSSSYEVISSRPRSSTTSSFSLLNDDSDDEIIWNGTESSVVFSDPESLTDGSLRSAEVAEADTDFVVLSPHSPDESRSATPAPHAAHDPSAVLDKQLSRLSLTHNADNTSSPLTPVACKKDSVKDLCLTITNTKQRYPPQKKRSKKKGKKPVQKGLGSRPIVDDVSECTDCASEAGSVAIYDDAVNYITSFLSNPVKDAGSHLTLLQSLIIELGLATSSIPGTLTSAKALLKSRAFLNIHEYLAVRQSNPSQLQSIMHPSRSSLIKDIRRKRNPASLAWVKRSGLQVLLVSCFH